MILIIIAIVFTAIPFSLDYDTLSYYLPITIGSVITVLLGELIIAVLRHKRKDTHHHQIRKEK